MANYTSQEAIEARLGRSLTAPEVTYLSTLLPAIDAYINSVTGTTFLPPDPDDDIEIYETADCSSTLVIPTMRTITSVAISSGFVDDFVTLDSSEYRKYPRSGPILALQKSGSWGDSDTTVRITGKLGYATVPADIASIAASLAVSDINANINNYKSERVGEWAVTYSNESDSNETGIGGISASSLSILNSYQRLSRSI